MEAAVERDDFVAPRVIARELDGGFQGFGAGIAEVNALGVFARSDGGELFGQITQIRIVKIRAGHVNQFGGLLLNRGDNVGMAMSGGDDGDSGGEIEEQCCRQRLRSSRRGHFLRRADNRAYRRAR